MEGQLFFVRELVVYPELPTPYVFPLFPNFPCVSPSELLISNRSGHLLIYTSGSIDTTVSRPDLEGTVLKISGLSPRYYELETKLSDVKRLGISMGLEVSLITCWGAEI
jgi:hypothetical protein